MTVPDVVNAEWLAKHKSSVVVLDVTYDLKPKPDPDDFKKNRYGRFEQLMNEQPQSYVSEHIPGAALFNIDTAYYPSKYIRFDLYPPDLFEKYVRLLGVNSGDHLVLYGRGPCAGMLWPGRAWWTFKLYGHDKVSVLDGGLDSWKEAGQTVTSDVVVATPGDWTVKSIDPTRFITFEELDKKNEVGTSLFEALEKINYLDARPAAQYNGTETSGAVAGHLKGSRNIPLSLVISEKGMKEKDEIIQVLKKAGYEDALPTVSGCGLGVQASLLALTLSHVGIISRVYNGSMSEVFSRAPDLVSRTK